MLSMYDVLHIISYESKLMLSMISKPNFICKFNLVIGKVRFAFAVQTTNAAHM